jgi:hypothetical protein
LGLNTPLTLQSVPELFYGNFIRNTWKNKRLSNLTAFQYLLSIVTEQLI